MTLPDGQTPLLIHNPRCSKSRAAKSLLEERGVDFELRLYLEAPLSRAELGELRRRLGRPAREWARSGEPSFSAAGLGPESDDAPCSTPLRCIPSCSSARSWCAAAGP